MTQYLDKVELSKISDINEIKLDDLGRVDTYNELKIKDKILKFKREGVILLLKCSIQMAIVGFGNSSFGFIHHDGVKIELIDIFKKYNIKFKNSLKDKLEDDDLTPRRLIRFFRFQIQKFIIKNNITSYLWNKYSDHSPEEHFKTICFPGSEHLIDNERDASFLVKTYENLDIKLETNIAERIKRVFDARGISFRKLETISDK